jgi:hypothetical protein
MDVVCFIRPLSFSLCHDQRSKLHQAIRNSHISLSLQSSHMTVTELPVTFFVEVVEVEEQS